MDHRLANSNCVLESKGGYTVTNSISFDGKLRKPKAGKHFVLLMTSFEPDTEAKFKLTLWYKKTQGKVIMDRKGLSNNI